MPSVTLLLSKSWEGNFDLLNKVFLLLLLDAAFIYIVSFKVIVCLFLRDIYEVEAEQKLLDEVCLYSI